MKRQSADLQLRYQQHVHFVGILVCFPGCELGCKFTHCLFSTVISSFLGSLEATSLYCDASQMTSIMFILQFHFLWCRH